MVSWWGQHGPPHLEPTNITPRTQIKNRGKSYPVVPNPPVPLHRCGAPGFPRAGRNLGRTHTWHPSAAHSPPNHGLCQYCSGGTSHGDNCRTRTHHIPHAVGSDKSGRRCPRPKGGNRGAGTQHVVHAYTDCYSMIYVRLNHLYGRQVGKAANLAVFAATKSNLIN